MKKFKTLRLILGDQLNASHSWFKGAQEDVLYVMMEMRQETDYVVHHAQKVLAFFGAMRRFAEALEKSGKNVVYLTLDAPENRQDLTENLTYFFNTYKIENFEYQSPDEYRVDSQLKAFVEEISLPTKVYDSEHFLVPREYLADFFKGKKTYLMERFYRDIRKRYDLLLEEDGEPVGGKWNFDAENRKRYDGKVPVPPAWQAKHDLRDIQEILEKQGVKTFGKHSAECFPWPLSRREAREVLAHFCTHLLPHFGTYQDAMHVGEPNLFHSRLSFALNSKMLHPLEVVRAAIAAWEAKPERISLSQIEGFVRQIIGWREYMRGVYWAKMPEYSELNFFKYTRKLPTYFWTGETQMRCVKDSVQNSLKYAYAHHIQRLMVTGNFALLAGISPDEVDAWYLGVYIDALEWVEITNTRGMSQYADGGIVGSKPYVASANYIKKMSNYCKSCHYDSRKKYGERACPFNSLYWHFYERHREQLGKHPRIGFAYRNLNRMEAEEREKVVAQAEIYLAGLEEL